MRAFLGTLERNSQEAVELDEQARMRHFAVLGKSGVGKTTLLRNMIISDLCSGAGLTVLDPHGSLIEEILAHIPRSRVNDVIYINPAHRERIVGLNVLESVRPEERHLVVQSIISIVKHAFPDSWGPRSEWVLEHAVMALLESPDSPALIALPKLLTNKAYRAEILSHVTDPAIRAWFDLYDAQPEKVRDEWISPLLNKVSKFVTNPLLRAVIGQQRSSFDFRWALDHRKVILINASKGALGESASSVLGSLIVTKLALASLSRQDIPEKDRAPHLLYIDEAHNFGYGVDYSTILAESRKYALGLVLGSQTLVQFSESTVGAIFGNVASIASYRVGHDDAQALVRHFAVSGEGPRTAEQAYDTIIPASELQNLPDHTFYFQTLKDGRPHDPVHVHAFPPIQQDVMRQVWKHNGRTSGKDRVIRKSLERYGRDHVAVESELNRFLSAA
jgi:uncharacterized protein DUF87